MLIITFFQSLAHFAVSPDSTTSTVVFDTRDDACVHWLIGNLEQVEGFTKFQEDKEWHLLLSLYDVI